MTVLVPLAALLARLGMCGGLDAGGRALVARAARSCRINRGGPCRGAASICCWCCAVLPDRAVGYGCKLARVVLGARRDAAVRRVQPRAGQR